MVDNVTVNEALSGKTIATDDVAGVQYQRMKLTLGADGVNDGDVHALNPLPVLNKSVRSKFVGTLVDGTPVVVVLDDTNLVLPPTIWAKPRDGDTVTVDYSLDGGITWETPWIVTTVNWDDVLVAGVTHIRFTRSAGTGILSTVGVV